MQISQHCLLTPQHLRGFVSGLHLALTLIHLACEEIHWSHRKKKRDITWSEHPLEMRVPSPLEQAWWCRKMSIQRASWSEGPGRLNMAWRSPCSPFWERCKEQWLRWPLVLETGVVLLGLEATVQVRNFSSSLQGCFGLACASDPAEAWALSEAKWEAESVRVRVRNRFWPEGEALPFEQLYCVVRYSTSQR